MSRVEKIAEEIAFVMPQIARRVLLGFFQSVEISQSQLFAIMTLYQKGPCKFSELSREMHIAAPTATGIVDRMERDGYVRRVPDKEDRRAINVELTAKGVTVAKKLQSTIKDRWQAIMEELPSRDREDYLRILKKIQGLIQHEK